MEIKNQYEENGYKITEYNNGTVVKEIISVIENEREPLSPEELHRLKVESDLEYIKCLQELQVGV